MQEFKAMRFSNSTKVYHSRNLLNFSEIKQIVPRSQIWFYGLDRAQKVANSYHRHKARHKGNKWQIRGNVKPPSCPAVVLTEADRRLWFTPTPKVLVWGFKSRQLGFLGMYNLPLSYFARISADPVSAQSLNPHSCKWLRRLYIILLYRSYLTTKKSTYRRLLVPECQC